MYSKSFATFLVGMKVELAYKVEMVIGLLISFIWPVVLIALWYAIFSASHSSTISGYSITSLASYYLISAALLTLMNADLFNNLAEAIEDGSVARYLTRPMSVLSQVFLIGLPDVIMSGLSRTLPMIILAFVLFSVKVNLVMLAMFIAVIVIGFAIMQLVQLIIGMSAVSFTQVYGLFSIFSSASGLLGGSFIPLNMLPNWITGVISLLPFQFAYYVPLSIINGNLSISQMLGLLPLAGIWIVLLCGIAYLYWRYAQRHIDAVGV
jgi:ABC-2 type transport system permease protein